MVTRKRAFLITAFCLLFMGATQASATPYIDGRWRGRTFLTADTCGGMPGFVRNRFRIEELFRNTAANWINLWEGNTYTAGRWTGNRTFFTTNGFEGSYGRMDISYEFSRVRRRLADLRVTTYITAHSGEQCAFQYSGTVRKR